MAKVETLKWNSMVGKLIHPPQAITLPRSPTSFLPDRPGIEKALRAPQPAAPPNLWVENGAIWQLPNLLVGFTNYASVTAFFASVMSSMSYICRRRRAGMPDRPSLRATCPSSVQK